MIGHVRGVVVEKSAAGLVVEVGGVGLAVAVPLSSLDRVPDEGREVFLYTHLHVQMRSDVVALYGFATRDERELFLALLAVSRVGPKLALACLSSARVTDLREWIATENVGAVSRISGVGRKTAERIVVELKEKITAPLSKDGARGGAAIGGPADEAALALEALGMKDAREKVAEVLRAEKGRDLTPEEIVRTALARGAR